MLKECVNQYLLFWPSTRTKEVIMYAWKVFISLKQVGMFYELVQHLHKLPDLSVINFFN